MLGKKNYYSFYNCLTEDISMLFIIFNIAEFFIFPNIVDNAINKRNTNILIKYSL